MHLGSKCSYLLIVESQCLRDPSNIIQVRGEDSKTSRADCVSDVADDLDLVAGKVGDLTVVLLVSGVAVCDYCCDSVLD